MVFVNLINLFASFLFGVFMVQIIKFSSDWVTFEYEGKCYSIHSKDEISPQELSKISCMTLNEVKRKYKLTYDSTEGNTCRCC